MTIKTIQQANAALQPYVPLVASMPGEQMVLDRVWPLMELLGNPQDKLKVIHIAGTSGKTSTAYYMAALLTVGGQKTGLTISPHVDSVTERVQINGQPLADETFCKELAEFLKIVQTAKQQPTYFELLYAFALWMFAKHEVDYTVVETGMGGTYDATNVARRPDKVCVITDIGLDHTHILGKTLAEIAAQKAGIIHGGNHVFMYRQEPEVQAAIETQVKKQSAVLHITTETAEKVDYPGPAQNLPVYQVRNRLLAYRVYKYLEQRNDLPHLINQELNDTQNVKIPGRMEIKQLADKTIIMDGAHNLQKMIAFLESFHRLYPNVKPAVLLALKEDKEYEGLVPLLGPMAGRVITTIFNTSQDLPVRSMDPEVLAAAFTVAGVDAQSFADQKEAVQALLESPQDVLIITGSFYLLSQIRNNGYLA
ncbi:hypothetical protein COY17_02485 [Candidatus Saccharibacteria bacterium CG_4_10_14_0_2_um_filter_52_9]|nr:MAG: hypothetical protein COY17_02485 [Candidatus Saccharibacteria bacterium CG_4_10_14_0_2_um_filter_52_9]